MHCTHSPPPHLLALSSLTPHQCNKGMDPTAIIHGYNNRFYTEKGNASATCDCWQGMHPLKDLPPGLEDNFTASFLPTPAAIIAMGRNKLFGGAQ